MLEKTYFQILTETERLILRPLQGKDYDKWLAGFYDNLPPQNNYDDAMRDMSHWTQAAFNDEIVEKHHQLARQDKIYVFGIFRKLDHKHMGHIDISTIMRDEFQWGAIGYRLHNQFWRKGYGKEAVQATLKVAFETLNFHRIEAHINLDNTASIKLAESAGMTFECMREKFIYEHDEWTDNLIYVINAR